MVGFKNAEARIITGIVMFVGIMILIGWVAINEPARMAAFTEQHEARSIEWGAEIYASNCSTCHGLDGRGIAGRAPGLNNPHLFGVDFLAPVNDDIIRLQTRVAEINARMEGLQAERDALFEELAEAPGAERQNEIVTRLGEIDALMGEGEGSFNAEIAALDEELAPLLEERDALLAQMDNALIAGYYPRADQFEGLALSRYYRDAADRLSQVGWEGPREAYIFTTLVHGRPGSNALWPEAMVAWGQTAGGPLREDQISYLVNYIMNWDQGDDWTLADLNAVQQYPLIYADAAMVSAEGGAEPVGVDADPAEVVAQFVDFEGDPVRGQALYEGTERSEVGNRLACSGCHLGGAQAPNTELQWALVVDERLNLEQYVGTTPEEYIVESIIYPSNYVVDGYSDGVMPVNYGEQLTVRDLNDIITYLRTYSEPADQ